MKKNLIVPVILCGGSGSRLWPLSRSDFPKQFLELSGKLSLFQMTCQRFQNLNSIAEINEVIVVTNEKHRFLALDQLHSINLNNPILILEPLSRNTAPALTLAALKASSANKDPILLITPSDHVIKNQSAFEIALSRAIEVASVGSIVAMGIKPDRPETGFGYIKQSEIKGKYEEFDVSEFKEKPSLNDAQKYIKNASYWWNSGIFVMKASIWLEALNKFRPDILKATKKAFNNCSQDNKFTRPDVNFFIQIPSESIDYAVMEKSVGKYPLKLIPLNAEWSDLGSWESLWDVSNKNSEGNVLHGDTLLNNTKDSLIYSSNRLVVASGLADTIIVETADSVLVLNKNQSQGIKTIVEQLELQKREERNFHRKISRPWGWFDILDEGERFKVKRIQVKPGCSLSLQSHKKRAEHWVIIKGVANVICGTKTLILKENESTYIPPGEKHQLSNSGKEILEIIEIQSGSYLGEDDIERFEDDYGRVKND